jgi:uncharacterized protein (TIGR02646 family)
MINQLVNPFNYSDEDRACIVAANNNWDSQRNCIVELKGRMHTHFDTNQHERCCYCGLLYDRTGRGEIDHIAPKGANYYPQFSYTSINLAKACQLCNSSSMKHTYDTIDNLAVDYEQCSFKIVHPYLDDHIQHYRWNYGIRHVLISVNNNSYKARESIKLFELASEKRTRARAIERNQERLDNLYNLPTSVKNRIKAVLKFK